MTQIQNMILQQAPHDERISEIVYDEIPMIVIRHSEFDAIFSKQGAQLLHWQPKKSAAPVIWLSNTSFFKQAVAIRGGVPICWPWFGDAGKPAHGFARNVLWELDRVEWTEEKAICTFVLTQNEQTLAIFPFPFTVSLTAELGETCTLTLKAQGDFESTAALHSYFAINDIQKTTVSGLGATYHERLSAPNLPKIEGCMRFDQEVDRIYTAPESIQIICDQQRKIEIKQDQVSDVVVWNPWQARCETMKDMENNGFEQFVCVESARLQQPITTPQQQTGTIGVKITVHAKS